MRFLSFVLAFAVSALLAACGGGGGSAGATPGNSQPLFTTAPSSVTLTLGNAQSYTIGGGKAPYTAVSSDISVAAAGVAGNDLTLGAIQPGNATITIRDSAGAVTNVAVLAKPTKALFTTAPGSVTIAVGNTNAQTFQVSGGVAPYVLGNSNASVLSAKIAGENLTLTGLFPGTANVVILDQVGASLTVSVTVTPVATLDLFTTASPGVTLPNGATATYTIGGGTPPYTATSANTAIATANASGTTLSLTAGNTGSTSVTVRDSAGKTVGVSVTVSPSQALFTTSPSSLTLQIGQTSSSTFGGGVGPYTVSTSNASVATVSTSGSTLTITGVATGTANIQVRDSAGTVVTIAVTVPSPQALFTAAAPAVTLPVNSFADYDVGGGVSPYTVNSNNSLIATGAIVSGKLRITTGGTTGSATLTLRDSVGATVTTVVTVSPSAAFFTTAPSAITVGIGAPNAQTFVVGGGVTPYTATSNNTAVATAVLDTSTTPTTVKITGVAAGTAQITLRDAVGATLTIGVTVSGGTTTPLTVTASPGVTVPLGTTPSYTVSGGTPGYTLTSNNTSIATVTASVGASGGSFTITPVAQGTATVTVRDSAGLSTSFTVTVQPATAFFTTAPSAVTLTVGTPVSYTAGGGVLNYTVTSNNPAVVAVTTPASGTMTSAGTFTLTPVTSGTATITLRDAAGTTLNISATSAASTALFTTAPGGAITLRVGTDNSSVSFGGGVGPYTITTSNASVVTVTSPSSPTSSTGSLTLHPVSVGTATVQIRDSTGATANIAVTVAIAPLLLNPSSATAIVGDILFSTITGGTGTFLTPTVTNPAVADASIIVVGGQNVLRVVVKQQASAVPIIVTDNAGNTANFTLTSAPGQQAIQISPLAMTVSACVDASTPLNLVLYGAATGTTHFFSSDPTVFTVPVSQATTSGTPLSFQATSTRTTGSGTTPLPAKTVTITAIDSTGAQATSTITTSTPAGTCPSL